MYRVVEVLAEIEYLDKVRRDERQLSLRAGQPERLYYVVIRLEPGVDY